MVQSTPELVNVNSSPQNMPATSHSTENQNQKRSPGFLSSRIPQKIHKNSETSLVVNNDFPPSNSGFDEYQKLVRSSSEESVVELPHEPKPLYIPKEEPMSLEENYEEDEGNIEEQVIPQEKLKILSVETINKSLCVCDSLECHPAGSESCETSEKIKAIRKKKLASINENFPSNQQDSRNFPENFMDTSKPSNPINRLQTEGGVDSITKGLPPTLEKNQGNLKLIPENVRASCSKGPQSPNNRPPETSRTSRTDEGSYYSEHVGEELNAVEKTAPVKESVLENQLKTFIKREVMLPEDDFKYKVAEENLPAQQTDDVSSLSTSQERIYVSPEKSPSTPKNGECSSGNSSTFSRNPASIEKRVQRISSMEPSAASEKRNSIAGNSPTCSKNLGNFNKRLQHVPETTSAIPENRKSVTEISPGCSKNLDIVNRGNQQIPRTLFVDEYSRANVVKNFNAAKRAEVTNEFDLAKIFAENNFTFRWGVIKSNVDGNNYNVRDIVLPPNGRFKRFFEIICSVFSAPVNCGYFTEEERNFVFKILTLREEEQDFLMEFLLGTEGEWFFPRDRDYDGLVDVKIEEELFEQILQMGLLESAYESLDESFFDIIDDVLLGDLYRMMLGPIDGPGPSRSKMISKVREGLRLENNAHVNNNPLLRQLTSHLQNEKGPILRLSPNFISLTHRILTIYYPDHNPHHHFRNIFSIITGTLDLDNSIRYPPYTITCLPLFKNCQSLIDYVEAKLTLTKIDKIIEKKATSYLIKQLTTYGNQIQNKLNEFITSNNREDSKRPSNQRRSVSGKGLKQNSPEIPPHIQQFSPAHLWSKILILIIKKLKTKKNAFLAKRYLQFLREICDKIPVDSATVYKDSIEIEMNILEKYEYATNFISDSFPILERHHCRLHLTEMLDIANEFIRKSFVPPLAQKKIREIIDKKQIEFFTPEIDGKSCTIDPLAGGPYGDDPQVIKMRHLDEVRKYYHVRWGFPKGVNSENLPLTIFGCLFWKELYDPGDYVLGAFVSKFQKEPLDLFEAGFKKNRESRFNQRMRDLNGMRDDDFWNLIAETYKDSNSVESIISHSFGDFHEFRRMIKCMKKKGVLDICRDMFEGRCTHWGFPDLFIWDERTHACKGVFVLDSSEKLSAAQKLWINVLVRTKVCVEELRFKVGRCPRT